MLLHKFTRAAKKVPIHMRYQNQNRSHRRNFFDSILSPETLTLITSVAGTSMIGFMMYRYKVCLPNERIVKTGLGIKTARLYDKTLQLPFQTITKIKLVPKAYHYLIDKAMSKEKITFRMPIAFTVAPKDDPVMLLNFAKSSSMIDDLASARFDDLVVAAVAGACRRQAGTLELEHIFSDRNKFRDQVIDVINNDICPFGLHILTMNIEELEDMEGNEYFKYLRKRALEGAVNIAKIDVAEKQREGDIGQKLHQSEARKELSELEKAAKLVENSREGEIAKSTSDLNVIKAEYDRAVKVAQLEANANADKRKYELQKEVEEYRKTQEIERLRASDLSIASVQAEVTIKNAEASATAIRVISEAKLLEKQNEAKGAQALKEAEARGIQALKEAEARGTQALREAEAKGLEQLVLAAGDITRLNSYLMMKDEIIPKVASYNAQAVRKLKPKINIWQTGPISSSDAHNTLTGTVTDIVRTSVPLFESLKNQTGIDILGKLKPTEQ
jgi:flotillin